jgi:hypothetical protein
MEIWRRVKKWRAVLVAYHYYNFLPVAIDMAQKATEYDLAPFKSSRRLRREYFFCLIGRESHRIIQTQRSAIQRFAVHWMSFLKQGEGEINPQTMFSRASLTSAFCQCADRLRFVNVRQLAWTFQVILEITEILATLAQVDGIPTDGLLRKTIVISRSMVFPEFYLIVLVFAIGRTGFQRLMSKKELKSWLLFEKVMLMSMTTSEALTEQFAGLQIALGGRNAGDAQ